MTRFERLELSPAFDAHVHLRDGAMTETVIPTIKQGGVDTVYVMPNLIPPITTVAAAIAYRDRLQALAPDVKFLMTLYLDKSITPATIAEAARAGIAGVKVYPAGVTTNSEAGVLDYESYYPVFEAMQEHDMVLNLHGEVPSTPARDVAAAGDGDVVTVLNAEAKFLPTLRKLHADFPRLRIVLEHCTTKDALDAVRACGPTVVGSITAHHLYINTEDVLGDPFNFCKPVAKMPTDRVALLQAIADRSGKFFFGSDSAPHPIEAKRGAKKAAAGCFTQGWATQLVVGAVEEAIENGWLPDDISAETLDEFLSGRGRRFYKIPETAKAGKGQKIVLEKKGEKTPEVLRSKDGSIEVVPFRRGEEILSLSWKS